MSDRDSLLLGVDAGGTKSTALVVAHGDSATILGRADAGPGNPVRIEADEAFANVQQAIEAACGQAGIPAASVSSAVVGMAGAGTEAMRVQAREWLQHATQIPVLSVIADYKLVLPAAFSRQGVAVISGTGSIVHGVYKDKEMRVGGHGYLIDDGGSGFWIGRQALKAIIRSHYGRGPDTDLTSAACRLLQETSTEGLIARIHEPPNPRGRVSSIAPLVVTTAVAGDQVANEILDRAADELAEMVSVVCSRLEFGEGYPLALAGSVLTKSPVVREKMVGALELKGLTPIETKVVTEPVLGATRLAEQVSV